MEEPRTRQADEHLSHLGRGLICPAGTGGGGLRNGGDDGERPGSAGYSGRGLHRDGKGWEVERGGERRCQDVTRYLRYLEGDSVRQNIPKGFQCVSVRVICV